MKNLRTRRPFLSAASLPPTFINGPSFLLPFYQVPFSRWNATHIFVSRKFCRPKRQVPSSCEYFALSNLSTARRLRRFDVITARRCRISRAANANTSQEKATLLSPLRWSRRRQSLATVSSDPVRMSGRTRKIKNEKAKKRINNCKREYDKWRYIIGGWRRKWWNGKD